MTGTARREPGVDAVRGLALLGSAVAVALLWLNGRQLGAGYRPLDDGPADRVVDVLTGLLVDARVLPVFALLLGWGAAEQLRRGTRATLQRRAVGLLGLGALHAVLVDDADVLGVLGLLLLLGAVLLPVRPWVQVVVSLLTVPALLLAGAALGLGGSAGFPDPPAGYGLSVLDRCGTWLLGLVLAPFTQAGLLVPFLLGGRLHRSGWWQDPSAHRRGLLLLGVPTAALGLLAGVPYARLLGGTGLAEVGGAVSAGALTSVGGALAAVGLGCLAVVLPSRVLSPVPAPAGDEGPAPGSPGAAVVAAVVAALAGLGRRSLLVYLAHSVVLALVLAPWAGGAGARWGSAEVSALALAVWFVSLVALSPATGRAVRAARPRSRPGRRPPLRRPR